MAVNSRRGDSRNVEMRRARRARDLGGVRSLGGLCRRLGTVAALGAVLALTACGFRLAGSDSLAGVLARPRLSLNDPYTGFSRQFEHQLKNSGATLQVVRANSTATT